MAVREIIDHQIDTIRTHWDEAANGARLTTAERQSMCGRQILDPFALYGY